MKEGDGFSDLWGNRFISADSFVLTQHSAFEFHIGRAQSLFHASLGVLFLLFVCPALQSALQFLHVRLSLPLPASSVSFHELPQAGRIHVVGQVLYPLALFDNLIGYCGSFPSPRRVSRRAQATRSSRVARTIRTSYRRPRRENVK